MAAPNRGSVVREVVERYAPLAIVPLAEVEDRRRSFLLAFIDAMPAAERAEWGLLVKTERNPPFIPSDILVWRPTMEHVDVLTDKDLGNGNGQIRPTWINNGVIGVAPGTEKKKGVWIWRSAADSGVPRLPIDPPTPPEPPPIPPTPPTPGDDVGQQLVVGVQQLVAALTGLREDFQQLVAAIERGERNGWKFHV